MVVCYPLNLANQKWFFIGVEAWLFKYLLFKACAAIVAAFGLFSFSKSKTALEGVRLL